LLQVGAKIPTPTKTSGAYYANPLYENNPWHHYAIVYDEEALTIRAYVDGASIYKIDLSAPFAPATKHAKRDYQFGYGANNHPAQITYDEVRMVRRALAPSEFMTWHRSNGGIAVIVR